jgi:hypothetical protein
MRSGGATDDDNHQAGFIWTPRDLCILYAVFLSLFALDVFDAGYGFWQAIAALLIHLIPVYIVIATLVLAWRWEWLGAIGFSALAIFYVAWTWGRFPLSAYLSISGPLFLTAILFLLNRVCREQRSS